MCWTINNVYRARNNDNRCAELEIHAVVKYVLQVLLSNISVLLTCRSVVNTCLWLPELGFISYVKIYIVRKAVTQLKQRAAGLSPWRSCINSRVNNVDFMEDELTQAVPALFPVNIHSTNAENLFIHRHPGMQNGPDKRPTVSLYHKKKL
jgi:hypothetical protein